MCFSFVCFFVAIEKRVDRGKEEGRLRGKAEGGVRGKDEEGRLPVAPLTVVACKSNTSNSHSTDLQAGERQKERESSLCVCVCVFG